MCIELLLFQPRTTQVHRKDDACNQEHGDANAGEVADALEATVGGEQETYKAGNGGGGACHHVTAGGVHQLAESQVLVAYP